MLNADSSDKADSALRLERLSNPDLERLALSFVN